MKEQFELLKSQVLERISNINEKRLTYRNGSYYSFLSTTILAALSTILLGLNLTEWANEIRITVLIITSLITVVNTYNSFFNHKELWIANNEALNKFRELKFNMEYFEKGTTSLDEDILIGFKNNYQEILNELNQTWLKNRNDTEGK